MCIRPSISRRWLHEAEIKKARYYLSSELSLCGLAERVSLELAAEWFYFIGFIAINSGLNTQTPTQGKNSAGQRHQGGARCQRQQGG